MPDPLAKSKEEVGKKAPEPPAPDDKKKAVAAYWAKKGKIRFYRGTMYKAGIEADELISEKKFNDAVKTYEKRVVGIR